MAIKTGTFTIDELLAVRNQSVADFGIANITPVILDDLAAHNAIFTDSLRELCEVTEKRHDIYGVSQSTEMVEVDEFGVPQTQNATSGSQVAFPLQKMAYGIGWTKDWFAQATPYDLITASRLGQLAHRKAAQNAIRNALFLPTNRTVVDRFTDMVSLNVKALVNADGSPIPDGPNGEKFDGATHTHYTGNAGLTATVATDLINNVVEHGHASNVILVISRANEAAFKALTGFNPYVDARLYATDGTPIKTLDTSTIDNRAIGLFGAAEVWVKSWVPAGYAAVYDIGGTAKPFAFREHKVFKGLQIASTYEGYPLQAEYMDAYFGVGAYTRTAAACLDFVNANYTAPSF